MLNFPSQTMFHDEVVPFEIVIEISVLSYMDEYIQTNNRLDKLPITGSRTAKW